MFKKKDIIMVIVVLLLAGTMAFAMKLGQGQNGGMVRIMVDGKEYGTYPLMTNRTIELKNGFGYNRIVLEDGVAIMKEADCPDQYCVEHMPILKTNETIVCLPHKLVVEVLTFEENGIDSVAQ